MTLKNLKTKQLGKEFIYFQSIDSTNDYCKKNILELPDRCCVFAERQLNGRGRIGKAWTDHQSQGVAMTIVLKNLNPDHIASITPIVGLAVKSALEILTGKTCAIKWPNDILMNHKKICGILCESVFSKQFHVICGIGVNVLQQESYFKEQNLPYGGSLLTESKKELSPLEVCTQLLNQLERYINSFLEQGFECFLKEYEDACVNIKKQAKIIENGHESIGYVTGISKTGALCVSIEGKEKEISSGDVSVRGLYGYI